MRLEHVGVLALQFLEYGDGLALSDVTPWLDRAGDWTPDGADVSQFENHLRALAGWSPGSTSPRGASLTMEIVGGLPDRAYLASVPEARVSTGQQGPRATFAGQLGTAMPKRVREQPGPTSLAKR